MAFNVDRLDIDFLNNTPVVTILVGTLAIDFSGTRAHGPARLGLGYLDSERVPWTTSFQIGNAP
jgi:hypothetical protein